MSVCACGCVRGTSSSETRQGGEDMEELITNSRLLSRILNGKEQAFELNSK